MQKELTVEDYQSAKDILKNNISELEHYLSLAKKDFQYFSKRLTEEPNDSDTEKWFEHARYNVKHFSKELKALRIAQKLIKNQIRKEVVDYKIAKEMQIWLDENNEIHSSEGWCDESDT